MALGLDKDDAVIRRRLRQNNPLNDHVTASLPMISLVSVVRFCPADRILVPLVEIGWVQRTSIQFTVLIKKGISELFIMYGFRVSHNLKTGLQLDVARRPSRPVHSDAQNSVGGGILRPVLLEHLERSVLITKAGRGVAAGHD